MVWWYLMMPRRNPHCRLISHIHSEFETIVSTSAQTRPVNLSKRFVYPGSTGRLDRQVKRLHRFTSKSLAQQDKLLERASRSA